eukprot:jgi/Chlat1/7071/Chrsp57S09118
MALVAAEAAAAPSAPGPSGRQPDVSSEWEKQKRNPPPPNLQAVSAPHIASFDWLLSQGIHEAISRVEPVEVTHTSTNARLRVWMENLVPHHPLKDLSENAADERLLPSECREGGLTYSGSLSVDVCYQVDTGPVQRATRKAGQFPVIVLSKLCHLRGLSQQQLVKAKEEPLEFGGYFIVNGIERIIRMLIQPRRHHVFALRRSAFLKRGPQYTDYGTTIRCVRPDQSAITVRLYYLQTGSCTVGFSLRRREYLIPVGVVLKAMMETTDREVYEKLAAPSSLGSSDPELDAAVQYAMERAELLLQETQRLELYTRQHCLAYLGNRFRSVLEVPETKTDVAVGEQLLNDYIFVHLSQPHDKFNLLIFMLRKLFALTSGAIAADNGDALHLQELLLPGHLINMFLKEKMQEWLRKFKVNVVKSLVEGLGPKQAVDFNDPAYFKTILDRTPIDLGQKLEYLLSTGNLQSTSGLDLQQATGFTVVAEKLNYLRYLSHFRSVHRGAYFAELRTTTVRKLLPESWGFMCPVHTPDGSPCGLLNHLTMTCQVVTEVRTDESTTEKAIAEALADRGMMPLSASLPLPQPPAYLPVMLDGRLLGCIANANISFAVAELRALKVDRQSKVPEHLEVAYIPPERFGPYPGLFLFTQAARMIRPVQQSASGKREMIGTFEQVYMDIYCQDGGNGGGTEATHVELHPTSMLSIVANLTPWSDYNQSPRNMYQCQMGKQTMGHTMHSQNHRPENKAYRLQSPQTPICRTDVYDRYPMDDYPVGTNAIVAVISYTGYDMEDAMIINKSSMERGFCHASLYKTETVDLRSLRSQGQPITNVFARGTDDKSGKSKLDRFVDRDGLPFIGQPLVSDEPYCSTVNTITGKAKVHKLKGTESAVVEHVALVGCGATEQLQAAKIKLRYNRNPVIGDKFSSRHGQKGVLSQLWPDEDMPWAATTGMRPDIIINPHAFPSRMTIGMLVESMAGKAGALHGKYQRATPFQFDVKDEEGGVVGKYGRELAKAGFNYHGTEIMHSGVLGTELHCEIYLGVVYYQRLRHMVSDKFQVRSTGPINPVTHQPVKGRKLGGGIRFGEMERDSLLAHGAAFLLHDRLHTCSDYHVCDVCTICGSMLSTNPVPRGVDVGLAPNAGVGGGGGGNHQRRVECRVCKTGRGIERVAMPYVYLASELAAMNMRVQLEKLALIPLGRSPLGFSYFDSTTGTNPATAR